MKRILSIDGGGIRGMITLEVLAELEKQLQTRLGRGEDFVLAETFPTKIAGYWLHAVTPPGPGAPVQFVREPENPEDPTAVAILDPAGQRLVLL